ncbi:response regulator [Kitasatospora viridis]|uniref:LuxR family two component transcriptional regulator n=1 Tax=Kitasatospora viridis TaxID=281105 RepID=A0A561T7G5_9ACTN|nr:response regulator transcription factor [Kitasatospora viridis]TWF83051.1 LuxR family two component transcriptional regulator [Kitasatospora viridis]
MTTNPLAETPTKGLRLLICDDHAVVRAGLLALLASDEAIDVVGEASNGEQAVTLAAQLHPQVVLMDLQLGPGIDGVTATAQITSAPNPPNVLVLTTYDTDADIARAIAAGAAGYLLKAEPPEELFNAIHAAARGHTALFSRPVASRVLAQMRSPSPRLTDREQDILNQLGQGLGNREISRALYISEATVKTHLSRIYTKLGVETRAGAVAVAKERRLLR